MMTDQMTLLDMTPVPIKKPTCVQELWADCPPSGEVQKSLMKCFDLIQEHDKIMCSISGGYDSDIMMDLIIRCGGRDKTTFVFNNTGLEYDATKAHIKYLEERYGVEIVWLEPKKAIPTCCREYGVPFWSKYISEMISRLKKHGFRWEDEPLDALLGRYPNCRSALRWWCNDFKTETGRVSKFNIEYVDSLKEFIMLHPPEFAISNQCCNWSKKRPAHDFLVSGAFDLNCTGVRKAEGGQRSTIYSSCYDEYLGEADNYRPLFWWTDRDKDAYRRYFGIVRSDCYEVWGMERTGCAGCPFGKEFEKELDLVQLFEPNRYRAMLAVFGQSYDYTRRFLEFRQKNKKPNKADPDEIKIPGV